MHAWGVHVQCMCGECTCNAHVGGACAMHTWGCMCNSLCGGVSLQLISLCGGVSLQLNSLCGGVSLQLIRLVNANDLIGCGGDP